MWICSAGKVVPEESFASVIELEDPRSTALTGRRPCHSYDIKAVRRTANMAVLGVCQNTHS